MIDLGLYGMQTRNEKKSEFKLDWEQWAPMCNCCVGFGDGWTVTTGPHTVSRVSSRPLCLRLSCSTETALNVGGSLRSPICHPRRRQHILPQPRLFAAAAICKLPQTSSVMQ